jgi:hypothetical protein
MNLKSVKTELDREDLKFSSELGWLAVLAFALVTFLPELLA